MKRKNDKKKKRSKWPVITFLDRILKLKLMKPKNMGSKTSNAVDIDNYEHKIPVNSIGPWKSRNNILAQFANSQNARKDSTCIRWNFTKIQEETRE